MAERKRRGAAFTLEEAMEFLSHLMKERSLVTFLIPLMLLFWSIERWVFSLSNWVPLVLAVWATFQYASYQRHIQMDDLNEKWKRIIFRTSPTTPLEHCEWLNKLLIDVWPNFLNPKISAKFSTIVEKRLKHRKPRLIERIELQEFSLGSCPPCLGLQGTRWSSSGDQRFMCMGFDWDANDISILMFAKLAKPLLGTGRIIINSLRIKGDLLLIPILDGKAVLYSFVSTPDVRIGVAFGSGGSQSLPGTELPGVSSWLVKLLTDTLAKTMVEPWRHCYSLPAVELRKKAVGGIIYVTVISGSKLFKSGFRGNPSRHQCASVDGSLDGRADDKDIRTFVEVELEELTRRTDVRQGSSPRWDSTFNMVLHDETGTVRFHLYECTPGSVKYDYLASSEIKMKYVADDSTTFWAVGHDCSVIARHAETCGKEVEMVVPFEAVNSGELSVRLVLKEWQFSDGSHSQSNFHLSSRQSLSGSSHLLSRTGRKINVTVVEGKNLIPKEKSAKCDPYVKLQYGKALQKTRTAHVSNPFWNQRFEFDEIGGGEYLKIKCYNEEIFGDDSIGSARVSLEGLVEGSVRDVWVPLEKVNSGELRLQIESVRVEDYEGSRGSSGISNNGWIELVLIEARDLVAADIRGTSDPYVRVQYGNLKKRTKVMYKTLNPKWHQTLEFPDDGSSLTLHVKDHNALLPTSNIGDCIVEYHGLPPNEMADKWIPLQGVKRGEIHIQITRKFPELQKRSSIDSEPSLTKAHQISGQMKLMTTKFHSLIEDGNVEGLTEALSELESLEDMQEEYMLQLETEQVLLVNKIKELGQEIFNATPSPSKQSWGS
ncbi:C2 domain-containing protein [Cephalotus follicularis]|uniref:C2 domain-containing protein n=1 Tax=Cephalotus follicularis TaxID=3775 RepID=A0A1Q3BN33_CEPFO|nr:C2 domain-containing protein [Cephalotus follicularis]